jgi:hypothetical protein
MMDLSKLPKRRCPDDGACHHVCGESRCFRTVHCGPLSNVYPNDQWPTEVCVGETLGRM